MPPGGKKRRRNPEPKFVHVTIKGTDITSPRQTHLLKRDWVCWVDPRVKGAKAWVIRFTAKNPLRDLDGKPLGDNAEIRVAKGAPSGWYRLKTGKTKGKNWYYRAFPATRKRGKKKKNVLKGEIGPAPGPEIIGDD